MILGPIGSYASGRLYPAERLVQLPDHISAEDAATVFFKGITAHYLLHSTYAVGPGTNHAPVWGSWRPGQIMVPWAKALGAFVIGVVSRATSLPLTQAAGCDAVLT